jgi:hypothetical protein
MTPIGGVRTPAQPPYAKRIFKYDLVFSIASDRMKVQRLGEDVADIAVY